MNSLLSIQDRCYRAFLLGQSAPLLPELAGRTIPAPISIQVYQNNARETYRKALMASYPVVERLVGEDCFRGLALKYMRAYPSTSGDLQGFGAAFPDFLSQIYSDSGFAYLPDVAKLEWAVEQVQLHFENELLDADALGRVDPTRYADLRFYRAAGARLVSSRYPILSIWRTNQPGQDASVDLDSGAEHVVVRRYAGSVELTAVDATASWLAARLHDGETLEHAITALGAEAAYNPEDGLAKALQQLTSTGLLSGFELMQPSR